MKNKIILFSALTVLLFSCGSEEKEYVKGFPVGPETQQVATQEQDGIARDTTPLYTRPNGVLLTGNPKYRLTAVYKLNYNEKGEYYYTGSNSYYQNYTERGHNKGNNWNYNFMPGLQVVYGYNMVNVSLSTTDSASKKDLFQNPVLIKTLYYPSYSEDTLNYEPVKRNYYMISVYDEDSNKDGYINMSDLRRFYVFNQDGAGKESIVPKNYSVISSEYDPANDLMYVFAQLDENKNGQKEEIEPTHVFWVDLKNPRNNGRLY